MTTQAPSMSMLKNQIALYSLEDLSILSAAKGLMQEDEVKKYFYQHFCSKAQNRSEYRLACHRMTKIVSVCKSLHIPHVLEEKILCTVRWTRDQFFHWINFVAKKIPLESKFSNRKDFVTHIMSSVVWDLQGTVNYQQSLHEFFLRIKNVEDDRSLTLMFKYACMYCLEDEIKLLWGKLSPSAKNIVSNEEKDKYEQYDFTHYWIGVLSGDLKKFSSYAVECGVSEFGNNVNNLAFAFSVFKGSAAAVKYFYKNVNNINMEHLLSLYLKGSVRSFRRSCQNTDILFFLLTKIDEESARRVINKYSSECLHMSIYYFPWHKFVETITIMCLDRVDQDLLYDLLTVMLRSVEFGNMEMITVKKFWESQSIDVRKSFCLYISTMKIKRTSYENLWENVTVDAIDMFLKDEECRNLMTPYENKGLIFLVLKKRNDVVDHWLKKCLVSEEAIIAFMRDFIEKKSATLARTSKKGFISGVNHFLQWAFKYEDVIDKEIIFKAKDEVIKNVWLDSFINAIKLLKWDELKKFIDWILKNREDYDDELIKLKREALCRLFWEFDINSWSDNDFAADLSGFLRYGVSDIQKLEVMLNEFDFEERIMLCRRWLNNNNWQSINNYFKFLSACKRDIWKVKEVVIHYVFANFNDFNFKDYKFCLILNKIIHWNSEYDPDKLKKIWEIKKLIIQKKNVLDCIFEFISKNWFSSFDDILNFLLRYGDSDENYGKIVFDFKDSVINKLMVINDFFGEKDHYLNMLFKLINWGKDNEKIKKEVWNVKKNFIEHFKNHVKLNSLPELTLNKRKDFVLSMIQDHKDECDFEITVQNLKDFSGK